MIKNSNSIYNLNDSQNKILSSKVEKEFNILNANVLDEMISGNIKNENLSTEEFVEEVLKLLEIEKAKFGDKQIK
ncbi:hypothetical protein [Sphingobacterium daejeonense]|uniref:hypothetical protein n=1 Tax=Sphingobacterium daejeonense TaxID=371142 RepID=UPI0010C4105A|nr:hypothetical protein [Sphingobacterium daejeonense]VTP97822.1 Uncharacterised protein [Sphingobacterium daejeonense]